MYIIAHLCQSRPKKDVQAGSVLRMLVLPDRTESLNQLTHGILAALTKAVNKLFKKANVKVEDGPRDQEVASKYLL